MKKQRTERQESQLQLFKLHGSITRNISSLHICLRLAYKRLPSIIADMKDAILHLEEVERSIKEEWKTYE